ncbi:MAG: response regulator, partial [Alphaproteobacteria bacterium]|nr:response regulator [Alphaproteobacteria bacterium]
GTDATKAIRGLSGAIADIPIIALTADIMEDAKSTYMAAGMNGYVGKPIDPDELADAIADAMEGRASA